MGRTYTERTLRGEARFGSSTSQTEERRMTGSQKRKGDRAEREVQNMLRKMLGVPARRMLGAGRQDDIGDIEGVPNTTIQVADWANVATAVRLKPEQVDDQRARAGTDFAATFIRLKGGQYRVVLTVEQWAEYWRQINQPTEEQTV